MDTTYFGRKFGLMIFMDNTTRTVLYYAIVSHETNTVYLLFAYVTTYPIIVV